MNTLQNTPVAEQSFKEFLFKNRRNRTILWLAAIAIVIQFAIFKYLYPYANYIHGDTFSYLKAAEENLNINFYPIGYSKFLRLFSVFNRTDYILTLFQYITIQCGALYLLFTLFYFYKPGKVIQYILLSFMVFNPLFLHLGNLISSDCLFTAISLTWFALLLWIVHRPSTKFIVWHTIVFFIAFTVRYNALIYPLITLLAFGLSNMTVRKKIIGLGIAVLLCGSFMGFTMYKYKQLTGYWQFSPFSGWQFANNAMYAYRYVDSADRKPVLAKYFALDSTIRRFYDRTRNLAMNPSEKEMASTFYMWSKGLPLMDFRDSLFKIRGKVKSDFKEWSCMGPLYKDYGIYIIRQYPLYFLKYFAWPNSRKYFAPPVEFLQTYNSGYSTVSNHAMKWFGYNSLNVNTRMKNPKTWVLEIFPILSGIVNVMMLFGLLYYCLLKGWQSSGSFNKAIIMAAALWLMNAAFTILASSAALRFQSFPVILSTIFALLLVDWMGQLMKRMKIEQFKPGKTESNFSQEAIA